MPALEAQAKPNAVAKRAAEEVALVTAAALQAEPGKEGKGEVVEQTITQDTPAARRRIRDRRHPGFQAAPEPEARKKDDDDSGRDSGCCYGGARALPSARCSPTTVRWR